MKKEIYLTNTPLAEATEKWIIKINAEGIGPLPGEYILASDSLGRVTAEALYAKISSPFYHSSAMDGYAVRSIDTFSASDFSPCRLLIGSQAVYVDTGDPVPDGFDAVIMIEDVMTHGSKKAEEERKSVPAGERKRTDLHFEDYIEIIKPATPWQHIRIIGEDIVSTELLLPENHVIKPVDIGAMISSGHVEIQVRRKPQVSIIPTGSELVEPGSTLKKGNIIEYNSTILSSLVSQWGGDPVRFAPVPDSLNEIKQAILAGCDRSNLVIVNAGSSAGSEDFTAQAIAALGEVVLHGVNIKPGKPVLLGWVKNRPVLGIPGYPVSTYITFNLFAKKLIYLLQGLDMPEPEIIQAKLARQIASSLGQEEFLRVKVGKVGEHIIASPVSRGAGVLMSLVRADGLVRIPAMSEGLGAGSSVSVELMKDKREIAHTVVCIGSHDNALDVLANMFKKKHPKYSLSSAHVGSMGGLIALKRGEAHMAGTHLLDEETGEYNLPFIKRILTDMKIIAINFVYRQQGFMVQKGNPKNIQHFQDLTGDDVVFINRQRGAGTRLLTDNYLKKYDIYPEHIKGYDREEYTHMGVASAVLSGIADAGVGILAAAKALDLDFVPVARERYDLVIAKDYCDSEAVSALVGMISGEDELRTIVKNLGGYDISDMGKILYET
jgi:putative molybdopterin biosynthesis protein